MAERRGMPDKRKVYNYWFNGEGSEKFRENEIDIGDPDTCFACGFHLKVERAHIVAVTDGGDNSVKNIHLLCPNCHLESEALNEMFYWLWLRNKNIRHYKMSIEHTSAKYALLDRDFSELVALVKENKFKEAARWIKATDFDAENEEAIMILADELEQSYTENKDE